MGNGKMQEKILFTLMMPTVLGLVCFIKDRVSFEKYLICFPWLIAVSLVLVFLTRRLENMDLFVYAVILLQDIGFALQVMVINGAGERTFESEKYTIIMLLSLCLAAVFVLVIHHPLFKKYQLLICVAVWTMTLMATLLFTHKENGVAAWIHVGEKSLQITEFVKMTFLILLATILCEKNKTDLNKYLLCLVVTGSSCLVLGIVKELGTALIMGIMFVLAIYLFMDFKYTLFNLGLMIVGVILIGAGIMLILAMQNTLGDESSLVELALRIRQRVLMVVQPSALASEDAMYQINHAKEALVSGGLFGCVFDTYVPEASSDFIFSALLANMGVVAGIVVIGLYLGLIRFGLSKAEDLYPMGFAQKLTTLFILELGVRSFWMIAGTLGIVPLTGIAMPLLVASGGTSQLVTYCMLGYIMFSQDDSLHSLRRRWR